MAESRLFRMENSQSQLDRTETELRQKGSFWLEPMKEFLLLNKQAKNLASRGEPAELRAFLKNIGSNFLLKGRKLGYEAKIGWSSARDFRSFTDWCWREDSDPPELWASRTRVPSVGVEPTRGFPHKVLSLARIPVSPRRHDRCGTRMPVPPLAHARYGVFLSLQAVAVKR